MPGGEVKIFISWSGERSYRIAAIFADWLPKVIQRVQPFLSSGIDKGARWSEVVAQELSQSKFGILCVTLENRESPWLLFEAGAISKTLPDSFVAPVLIGVDKAQLAGSPLSQFQMSDLNKIDLLQLAKSINKAGDGDHLEDGRLVEAFEAFWPDFLEKAKDEVGLVGTNDYGSSGQTSTPVTAKERGDEPPE
ncbi:MAG: hypothetical protein ACYDD1_14895, partial [Caulobacteraceae bacterium]